VFLLFLVLVCFLANFFFFFEDEHLLSILIVFLLCLSLALIATTCDDLVKQKQIETYKLLLKNQLIKKVLFSELQKISRKLAFLVDFFAAISFIFIESVPTLIFDECADTDLNIFQITVNKLMLGCVEDMSSGQFEMVSEFVAELSAGLTLEEQE
jgi:hypothetical protein